MRRLYRRVCEATRAGLSSDRERAEFLGLVKKAIRAPTTAVHALQTAALHSRVAGAVLGNPKLRDEVAPTFLWSHVRCDAWAKLHLLRLIVMLCRWLIIGLDLLIRLRLGCPHDSWRPQRTWSRKRPWARPSRAPGASTIRSSRRSRRLDATLCVPAAPPKVRGRRRRRLLVLTLDGTFAVAAAL